MSQAIRKLKHTGITGTIEFGSLATCAAEAITPPIT